MVVIMVVVLAIGYIVTVHMQRQLEGDSKLPFFVPISVAAAATPTTAGLYAGAMTFTATILFFVANPALAAVHAAFVRIDPSFAAAASRSSLAARVAAVALAVQGVLPLTTTAISAASQGNAPKTLDIQSALHQSAAGIFFIAATIHSHSALGIASALADPKAPRIVRHLIAISPFSLLLKRLSLALQILVPVALAAHPASASPTSVPSFAHTVKMLPGIETR